MSRRLSLQRLEDRLAPAWLTVTSAADAGTGSLRDLIALANATAEEDTIVFASSLNHATISLSTIGSTNYGPTAFRITQPLSIIGTGQTLTRAAATPVLRFFFTEQALILKNLTLDGGTARGGDGGTGYSGGGGAPGLGGAIWSQAPLTLIGCLVSNNQAVGGTGGANPATDPAGGGGGGGLVTSAADNTTTTGGVGGTGVIGPGGAGGATGANGGFGGYGGGGGGGGSTANGGSGGSFAGGGGGGSPGVIDQSGGNGGYGGGGAGAGGGPPSGGQRGSSGYGGGRGGLGGSGGAGGGGGGLGGAIFADFGTLDFINTTFAGNVARGGDAGAQSGATVAAAEPGWGAGGAVFNLGVTARSANCTFTSNAVVDGDNGTPRVPSEGSALMAHSDAFNGPADTTLINNIIYGNAGSDDVRQVAESGGSSTAVLTAPNIIGSITGGTITGSGSSAANPLLDTLKDNGGPTATYALLPGSPALNGGTSTGAPLTDQRGTGRDNPPDLGAYEAQHPLSPVGVPIDQEIVYGPHPNASQTEAYVKGLYQTTLLRSPAQSEIDFYVDRLTSGNLPRAQAGNSFINSPENRGNQVTFFYRYFLDRDPDQAGLDFYIARLQSGESEASVLVSFVTSPEFAGQNTDTQYVQKMYFAILGRGAAQSEIDFYVIRLGNGQLTRSDLVNSFLNSPEGIDRVTSADFIAYLKRNASSFDLSNFRQAVQGGATFGQLAISILGSDEFFGNAGNYVP